MTRLYCSALESATECMPLTCAIGVPAQDHLPMQDTDHRGPAERQQLLTTSTPVHSMQAVHELRLPHGIVQPPVPLLLPSLALALSSTGLSRGWPSGRTLRGPIAIIVVVVVWSSPVPIGRLAAYWARPVAAQPSARILRVSWQPGNWSAVT